MSINNSNSIGGEGGHVSRTINNSILQDSTTINNSILIVGYPVGWFVEFLISFDRSLLMSGCCTLILIGFGINDRMLLWITYNIDSTLILVY